jgi:hypothetical protein
MEEKINNQDVFCAICELPKENGSKFCNKCQKETPDLFKVSVAETLKSREAIMIKQKRLGFKGFLIKKFSGYKPSGDPKFPEGVDINMTVDVENNKYDQVVKNNVTGEIIHEEHKPLDKHGSKPYKK